MHTSFAFSVFQLKVSLAVFNSFTPAEQPTEKVKTKHWEPNSSLVVLH